MVFRDFLDFLDFLETSEVVGPGPNPREIDIFFGAEGPLACDRGPWARQEQTRARTAQNRVETAENASEFRNARNRSKSLEIAQISRKPA